MTARLAALIASVTDLGNVTGVGSLNAARPGEQWAKLTLTGSSTLTISGQPTGITVRLIVTQDSTGGRTLTVSDGSLSTGVAVNEAPNATTLVTVYRTGTGEMVVTGNSQTQPARAETTDYTLTSADQNRSIVFATSSAAKLTIPASSAFNSGSVITVYQTGSSTVEIQAAAGVAILSSSGRLLSRGSEARLVCVGLNTWVLTGTLAATTAFDVTTLTSLTAWLKADALALNDGDAVGTYTDSSSAAHNATQSTTANKPTYKLGGRNGRPTVHFDGTNDSLAFAGITNNTAARTIIAVVARTDGGTAGDYVWEISDQGAGVKGASGAWSYVRNQALADVSLGGSTASLSVVGVRFNTTSSADWFLNSAATTNFDPKDSYQDTGSLTLFLGAEVSGNNNLAMDLCEFIVCDAALSGTELTNTVAYLKAKWGI